LRAEQLTISVDFGMNDVGELCHLSIPNNKGRIVSVVRSVYVFLFDFVVRRPCPSIERDASYIMEILFCLGFNVPAIYSQGANYAKPPPLEIRSDRIFQKGKE
jgi:hypothetical protein